MLKSRPPGWAVRLISLTAAGVLAAPAQATVPGLNGRIAAARQGPLVLHQPWASWRAHRSPGSVPVGAGPQAAALDSATRTLYVTNGADGTVSVLDAAACNARRAERCGGPVATIAVGTNPVGVAVVQRTRTLYVANADSGTVSVIDVAACNARATTGCGPFATVAVGGLPLGLAVDEATQTVYVGNYEDFVSVVDAASCTGSSSAGCAQTAARIATGPVPAFPTFDATTRTLYVPDNGDGSGTTMSVIDTRACNAASTSGCSQAPITTTVGAAPTAALVDPETQTVYVPNQNDFTVSVVNGATCNATNVTGCGQTWPTVRVGAEPNASLALDHRSDTLFVVNNGSDTISAVDAAHCNARNASGCGEISRTLATGDAPSFIVLDPASDTLYVPNMVGGDVSLIDARGCNAQRTVACRREAPTIFTDGVLGLDVDPATHTLYVIAAGRLTLVDTQTCNAGQLAGCAVEPAKVPFGQQGTDVAVDVAAHTVYVSDPVAGAVFVLDASTCNAALQSRCGPVATLALGGSPLMLALNPRTHALFVSDISKSAVEVIHGARCSAQNATGCADSPLLVPTSDPPWAIAVDQSTNTAYVSLLQEDATRTLAVLDGAACDAGSAACGPIAVGAGGRNPLGLTVDPAAHTLYLAVNADEEAPGSVAIVDTRRCRAGDTSGCGHVPVSVPAGRGTREIVVDPVSHTVFSGNFGDASVSVIEGASCNSARPNRCPQTPPRVPVGNFPLDMTLDQAHHTLYVGNAPDRTVSIIDTNAPCRPPHKCLQ